MNIPEIAKPLFKEVYDKDFKKTNSDAHATAVAWGVVKGRLTKKDNNYVALSSSFSTPEYYTLNLFAPENKLIINATGDEITFEGILASTDSFQQDGVTVRKFSENALKDLAEQINKNGSSHPDVDHETMKNLVKQYGNNYEMIMNSLPKSKGFIKSIQAIYENGKLWIKGVLNNSYKKIMKVVKGMSIEAISEDVDLGTSTINKAKYLGFTFAVKSNPKIAAAKITSVV